MQKIRWFLLIVAILIGLALVLQNNDSTPVRVLWIEQSLPLSVILFSTTAIGFLLGAITTVMMLARREKGSSTPKKSESKPPEKAES